MSEQRDFEEYCELSMSTGVIRTTRVEIVHDAVDRAGLKVHGDAIRMVVSDESGHRIDVEWPATVFMEACDVWKELASRARS